MLIVQGAAEKRASMKIINSLFELIIIIKTIMKVRDHWEDLAVSGRITLRWTLGRWVSMG
jgi:hypothetical protein